MTRQRQNNQHAMRTSLLDSLHLGALLACSIWTAKLIAEDRFGPIGDVAVRLSHLAQRDSATVTIRLDERAQTAAR